MNVSAWVTSVALRHMVKAMSKAPWAPSCTIAAGLTSYTMMLGVSAMLYEEGIELVCCVLPTLKFGYCLGKIIMRRIT